ncbi:MAG: hypothetical protein ACKVOW_05595 [Chitinophagaceae bacterium]
MKKLISFLFAMVFFSVIAIGQNDDAVQKPTFGIQFFFNDFKSAANLRANSLGTVIKNKEFGKIKDMSPGLALTFIKGITRQFDFTSSLAVSYLDYPVQNKPQFGRDLLLLEADFSVRGKLISNKSLLNPYLQAGLGASKYKNYYGTFLPVGMGMQVNLFNEAYLLVNAQYRFPITETTNHHFWFGIGIAGNIGKKNSDQ